MKEFPNDCGDKFDAIDLEICSKLTNMSNDDTEKALKDYMSDDLANELKETLFKNKVSQADISKIISDIYILISNIYKLYNKFIDNDILPKNENFETILTDRKKT